MRQRPERHFLLHTIEHLFGVFAILVLAVTLGVIGKFVGVAPYGQAALTTNADNYYGTTSTGISTPNMPSEVSFSTERIAIACTDGVTKAKYHFRITPADGGYVMISSSSGSDYIYQGDGQNAYRYYGVGSYVWSGSSRAGYVGGKQGTFTVENVCSAHTDSGVGSTTTTTTTTTSTTTTTTNVGTNSTSPTSLVDVSFSAQPGPAPKCTIGTSPLTPVFLVVTKSTGGEFLISSNTGMNNARFVWGEYFFPNGTYSWSADVKPGFQGDGSLAGSFEIDNTCEDELQRTGSTTTSVTPEVTTTTATYNTKLNPLMPPLPRPQLHLFLNNTPVTEDRIFNKEEVEFRITTALAENVEIIATPGIGRSEVLAEAVEDKLLSEPGIDVWSYVVDMSEIPEGTTKIHVRVKHADGRETLSERMGIIVKHPIPAAKRVLVTSANLPVNTSSGTIETSVRVSARDREAVLARVSDPSSCTNAEECKIYCRSLPGVNDLCVAFAQESFAPTMTEDASLTDSISDSNLAELLRGGVKHATELPEYVSDVAELKEYCGELENSAVCAKILVDSDLRTDDQIKERKERIMREDREQKIVFVERTGTRVYTDSDIDGVTDYDEVNIYHTDPQDADSDQDGFTDGAELLARTNPSGGKEVATTSGTLPRLTTDESVEFHNPMISGETNAELLVVKNVEVVEIGENRDGVTTAKKLRLAGTAMPNAFVTIYIFSEPIVVTVKADGAGSWVYTLDKELPDGTHQVYSAITDAGGRILAKSEPLPFIKVAAAVSLGSATLSPEAAQPGFFTGASLYAMLAILIGILGVALSIIGFIVKQKGISDSADLPGI